jgi:hypothetical protein
VTDWERYLDDLEALAASAVGAATIPQPERPTTAMPLQLATRARLALEALESAELTLEQQLASVRDELRASNQGRRRTLLAAPAPRASTLDIVA